MVRITTSPSERPVESSTDIAPVADAPHKELVDNDPKHRDTFSTLNHLPRVAVKPTEPTNLRSRLKPAVSAVVVGAGGITSLITSQPAVAAAAPVELVAAETLTIDEVTNPSDINLNINNGSGRLVNIRQPVGPGAINNASDVKAVQERLNELGFNVSVDGQFGPQTSRAIRVFEAMVRGEDRITNVRGIIRGGDQLHRILESSEAPRWVEMPNGGVGFVNGDRDNHDYGSDHVVRVVRDVGERYNRDYLRANPDAAKIATNDVSLKNGGDTPDHITHENGLDLDIRLPRVDGSHGSRTNWANYDREATFAMIKAFGEDPNVERIIFSDNVLLERIKTGDYSWSNKVFHGGKSHHTHVHIDIAPPKFNTVEGFKSAELLNRRLGPPIII